MRKYTKKKKSSGNAFIFMTLLVVLAMAVAGGLYFLTSHTERGSERQEAVKTTEQQAAKKDTEDRKEQDEKSEIKSTEESKPEPKPAPKRYAGKLAIVVDDCGTDLNLLRKMLALNTPFSYAVLPNKQFSSDAVHIIKSKGNVALLHLPMEPMDRAQMSEKNNTVQVAMSQQEAADLTRKLLNSMPGVIGVNNHQGSRATSNEKTMQAVLRVIKAQGLFFIDSNTLAQSVGDKVATKMGVPTGRNDMFIDGSTDVEEIKSKIWRAIATADKNGSAIAICHVRPNTVVAWQEVVADVKASGITLVPVTALLR